MNNSMSFFLNKYLVLLLAFFSRMIINIGGEVSPTLIFIGLTLPIWYKYIRFDKNALYFTKIFVLIITVQLCWIPFAHTDIMTQMKGVSITMSGLLFFLFYYFVFINKPNLLKWHLLGSFISTFFFINVLAEIAGGEFGMWKFQIYPRIVLFVVLVCIWCSSKKIISNLTPLIFISIGMLGLATGARSSGLAPFIAGVIIFFVKYKKNISFSKLKANFIKMAFVMYLTYALIYVPNVLNGNISGGNSEQLKQAENPYNPLNLLMMGRTDSVIPFLAFLEKPITGWGYNTPDPDLKYHYLMSKLTDNVKTVNDRLSYIKDIPIPGHSVIGYYACSYGIVMLLLFCVILYRFSKIFIYSLFTKDKFLFYRIYIYIYVIWNLFFSPAAHFKTLPCSIGILVALSLISISKRKEFIDDRNIK